MKCLLLAALLTLSVSGNAWGGEKFPETVEDYISACKRGNMWEGHCIGCLTSAPMEQISLIA
jgi:hypothetical protein